MAARARGRRFAGSASARRRRVWARHSSQFAVVDPTPLASVVDLLDLFAAAALGRASVGTTIGAVKLQLGVVRNTGTAPNPGVLWGLQVGPRTMDPADLDPGDFTGAAGAHADWMMWTFCGPTGLTGHQAYDIKSQRKMDEVGQTLWFAVAGNSGTDTFNVKVTASTLLLLP